MEKLKEWFIDAPWGKIALASWGNAEGEPVLLLHGRQDSLSTFIPLLGHLPDNMYYVDVDLPGHGLSDPIPIGVSLTRLHLLAGLEYALRHLGWVQFTFIGHSMGCEIGLFYNAIHSGRMKELIFLDPIPALQRLMINDPEEYYQLFYEHYYSDYARYNSDERVYSRLAALDAVMRARGLTRDQAELVLARNLKQVGEDQYRLSWDRRLKFPASTNYGLEYYCELFRSAKPALVVNATELPPINTGRVEQAKQLAQTVWGGGDCWVVNVEGPHDVHLTDPKAVAEKISAFLGRGKAKL